MSTQQQIDIEVRVDSHPSGRLTLKERNIGELMWSDVADQGLLGNLNHVSFYRQVARRLANHAQKGIQVVNYND
ncbi:MAG: hypothetical protein ACYC2J_11370 [Acidithiobacillus ferrooxidans]|jgi:hypothetical protein|uniref:Uncharacterized protein n=1 Tax=mine drainage metagenome TaxID=410659 RepID=E6QA08_9ZZZZ